MSVPQHVRRRARVEAEGGPAIICLRHAPAQVAGRALAWLPPRLRQWRTICIYALSAELFLAACSLPAASIGGSVTKAMAALDVLVGAVTVLGLRGVLRFSLAGPLLHAMIATAVPALFILYSAVSACCTPGADAADRDGGILALVFISQLVDIAAGCLSAAYFWMLWRYTKHVAAEEAAAEAEAGAEAGAVTGAGPHRVAASATGGGEPGAVITIVEADGSQRVVNLALAAAAATTSNNNNNSTAATTGTTGVVATPAAAAGLVAMRCAQGGVVLPPNLSAASASATASSASVSVSAVSADAAAQRVESGTASGGTSDRRSSRGGISASASSVAPSPSPSASASASTALATASSSSAGGPAALCSVCMERQCNTAFYDCGHMCCAQCAAAVRAQYRRCHICRRVIKDTVRVYS